MDVATGVTVAAYPVVIATLLVYARQATLMARQSKTLVATHNGMIYQHLCGTMIGIDRMFVDHPELRPYFYDGVPAPNEDPLRSKVVAVAEMFLDFVDSFVVTETIATNPSPDLRAALDLWIRYFTDMAATSLVLRQTYYAMRDWYSDAIKSLMDAACAAAEERNDAA